MNGINAVLKLDIEELESDGIHLKISALKNAARISKQPLLKCCLGPGADGTQIVSPGEIESLSESNKKPTTPPVVTVNRTIKVSSPPIRSKPLDYDVYDKFASIQLAEKHRKNLVRKELDKKRKQFQIQQEAAKSAAKLQNEIYSEVTPNEVKSRVEQLIIDEAEKLATELLIENDRRVQQRNEEHTKRIDQLKKQHAIQQQQLLRKRIFDHHREFVEMYEEFGKKFRTLKTTDRMDKLKPPLIQILMKYNAIDEKLKNNNFDENDLIQADEMLDGLNALSAQLDDDLIAEASEAAKTVDATQAQVNTQVLEQRVVNANANKEEVQQLELTNAMTSAADNGLNQFVSSENFTFYNNIMSFYTSKVEGVKPLQANETLKKYRSNCQKAINIPVNAISAVSAEHLKDKYDKLYGLISGEKINTSDGPLSAFDHPLGRDFCLLLMAKKFVSQGDSAVSSNPQAAFPIAAIVVAIWQKVPEFGQLFLAYVFKECPYLVPYFIPQVEGQAAEEYCKVLGYRMTAEGLEKQDMYLKRQTGLVKLYAAVMVTRTRPAAGAVQHPYGIENGWRWLNNLLNLEPLPDICATLIHGFLQIAGFEMFRIYRSQFMKLLRVMQSQYLAKLSKIDEGGPKSRLEVFLMKILNENTIEKPPGLLALNFW